jgi:hypothetical protein
LPQGRGYARCAIVDRVVADAGAGIVFAFAAQLFPFALGDNLNDHIRRLTHLPDQVGAIFLALKAGGGSHLQAERHIGHQGGQFEGREQANIGCGQKGDQLPRVFGLGLEGGVESAGEQALQLFGENAVRGLIILDDQVAVRAAGVAFIRWRRKCRLWHRGLDWARECRNHAHRDPLLVLLTTD